MTFVLQCINRSILIIFSLIFLTSNVSAVAVVNITQLTYGTETRDYGSPSWSPDGSKIAYISGSGHNYSIWIMNANGSNPVQLTTEMGVTDYEPRWSPDGSKIVFQRTLGDGSSFIYILYFNTSNPKMLLAPAGNPAISPDGRHIAFDAGPVNIVGTGINSTGIGGVTPEQGLGIYVMDIYGTSIKRLTDYPGNEIMPSWSPDGNKIVFTSGEVVHIMNADGSNVRSTGQSGYHARWSPDGKYIAFLSERAGDTFRKIKLEHIYVMDIDGTNVTQLTFGDKRWDGLLDWSPDGKKIVFESSVPTAPRTIDNIYTMTIDFNATQTPTPKAPGFSLLIAIVSLSILVLIKRIKRRNQVD